MTPYVTHTERGVEVKIKKAGSRAAKLYCPQCKKRRKPLFMTRTRNTALSRLLKYSSTNELCSFCYSPLLQNDNKYKK